MAPQNMFWIAYKMNRRHPPACELTLARCVSCLTLRQLPDWPLYAKAAEEHKQRSIQSKFRYVLAYVHLLLNSSWTRVVVGAFTRSFSRYLGCCITLMPFSTASFAMVLAVGCLIALHIAAVVLVVESYCHNLAFARTMHPSYVAIHLCSVSSYSVRLEC